MAITLRSTPAVPAPDTTLQGLLTKQGSLFRESREVVYCSHRDHTREKSGGLMMTFTDHRKADIVSSDRMRQITGDIFHLLQSAAFTGKTEATLTFPVSSHIEVALIATVLQFFQNENVLRMKCNWANWVVHGEHSTFCSLFTESLDLKVWWEATNPYLNPKPMLQLPAPELWGLEKLNQERLEGKGDFTIAFGKQDGIPVHRLVVRSFSPFMSAMLQSTFQEGTSKSLEFPEVTYCSPEALEALVTLMYTRKIDFDKLPPSGAIQLLEVGSFFLSDALKGLALTHLHGIGETLSPLDLLHLSFLQIKYPSENLRALCDWLLKIKPKFYESLLEQEKVAIEDLFRLFGVSVEFNIEVLKERLKTGWDKLETAQKTAFVDRALGEGAHIHLLRETEELCKSALKTMDSKDPERPGFVAAYKRLNAQIVELNTN